MTSPNDFENDRRSLERRPVGTGEDGAFVHDRAPTIDDIDDVDDEDGTLQDELEGNSDLKLSVEPAPGTSGEDAGLPDVTDEELRREDKGAVNLEPEDLEP